MAASRRCAVLLILLLAAAACGGGSVETTTTAAPTTTTTTAPTTTGATTTSTTVPPDTGPLAGLLAAEVADPLLGSGYHAMEYGDATRSYVVSQDDGVTNDGGRLFLAPFDPAPATTGIGADQILLEAWIDPHNPATAAPRAMVLYGLGVGGWNPYVTIEAAAVLTYLETTTDYAVRAPGGPADVRIMPTVFDWTGSAHFIAGVAVFAYPDTGTPAYEGQIECTYVGSLECTTLSDDGILRPGDEGEPVAALQEALANLGFYTGAGEGLYDEATEEAVRLFQRDYRLAVDGKAGPRTLTLIDDVASGRSDIVMASQEGVGEVLFGTAADNARAALIAIFGAPDDSTGWFSSACAGDDWLEIRWDGFTAIFTDRNGSRQFDGWEVADLQDLPSWLYFAGGIRPSWRWSDFEDMGARFDLDPDGAGFWYHHDLGYNNGRFVNPPSNPPAAGARVASFGTGTGAFVSC